jgi:Holliday junction resolvasome RuvABC endonuclease subunit
MLKILAYDISIRNIGWAYRLTEDLNHPLPEDILVSGSVKGTLDKTEPTYKRIREMVYFLERTLPSTVLSIDYILIERSFIAGSGDVTRMLAEIQGVVKDMLYQKYNDYVLLEPTPSTWRHIILGSGKVDKKKTEVWEKCRLLNLKPTTEHEAEAMLMSLAVGDEMFKALSMKPRFDLFK